MANDRQIAEQAGGYQVIHLDGALEDAYESFVRRHPKSLFYYTLAYRDFLGDVLVSAKAVYFVVQDNSGAILGVMPSFVMEAQGIKVMNSLPFYGSHGSPLVKDDDAGVYKALIDAFESYAAENGVHSSTVISNIHDAHSDMIAQDYLDDRIGQITPLPDTADEDILMAVLHQKTRNMARKGLKSGFEIETSESDADWDWLYETHVQNMEAIGGLAKPQKVFDALRARFDGQYRLYMARRDGRNAAAALLINYNDIIEYYTPVIHADFRSDQPLSAIIFKAMQDGIEAGQKRWNWGGTWKTQEGVYRFKSRWGAEDIPYKYYTKLCDEQILKMSKEELLKEFPYFFTIPFSALDD